ncbi:hypothetical protein LOAG_01174 [Loa loa]|uniref:Uncharacterized protein n=1 Tax=Loa loa TaxID=7209 RepID=A0A1S0UBN6_LOALO|nr:hypothetical protein LOAG_01174 [Loa loa]EFO27310.1 hypothetical protein LOAG_01174 [Loa loa]
MYAKTKEENDFCGKHRESGDKMRWTGKTPNLHLNLYSVDKSLTNSLPTTVAFIEIIQMRKSLSELQQRSFVSIPLENTSPSIINRVSYSDKPVLEYPEYASEMLLG